MSDRDDKLEGALARIEEMVKAASPGPWWVASALAAASPTLALLVVQLGGALGKLPRETWNDHSTVPPTYRSHLSGCARERAAMEGWDDPGDCDSWCKQVHEAEAALLAFAETIGEEG